MTVTAIQIGLHPDAVDYESADFSQFKGLTKEGLTKANSANVAGLRAAGYEVDNCLIQTGEAGARKARTWCRHWIPLRRSITTGNDLVPREAARIPSGHSCHISRSTIYWLLAS